MQSSIALLPGVLFLLAVLLLLGALHVAIRLLTREPRTGASAGLLREPGRADARRLAWLNHRLCAALISLPAILLVWHVMYVRLPSGEGVLPLASLGVTGLLAVAWNGQEIMRLWPVRLDLRGSIEAQVTTARTLNLLMREEYWVLHDVPFKGQRIHHLVIGPRGVFVIESLWRQPQPRWLRKWEWPRPWPWKRVVPPAEAESDGTGLRLDGREESVVFDDVCAKARRISIHFSGAAGELVPVHAAIALPGWRIRMSDWSRAIVFNPAAPKMLIEAGRKGVNLDRSVARSLLRELQALQRGASTGARSWIERAA